MPAVTRSNIPFSAGEIERDCGVQIALEIGVLIIRMRCRGTAIRSTMNHFLISTVENNEWIRPFIPVWTDSE
jgi:hypothetical protein